VFLQATAIDHALVLLTLETLLKEGVIQSGELIAKASHRAAMYLPMTRFRCRSIVNPKKPSQFYIAEAKSFLLNSGWFPGSGQIAMHLRVRSLQVLIELPSGHR
jgi:hypothetical protein